MPSDKPSGPTLGTRLIIFSALVLPSALIPLLVLRRGVNNLHRKLSVRREKHEELQNMISEMRNGLTQLHGETYRKQKARARDAKRMRDQVEELEASNEAQIWRLRQLGTSLADVAAFMQEMELQQGFFTPRYDGKGIERLRFLAMQFEGLGKANATDADVIRDATQGQMWIWEGLNEVV
ncbi:hypothetical protein BGY98DRAFT_1088188 [Russula aff. rugulosa BPL654]|nr:hypothetical protein BGY98DRAFT_1088188 [Russula aff. rugulosa BPL654]